MRKHESAKCRKRIMRASFAYDMFSPPPLAVRLQGRDRLRQVARSAENRACSPPRFRCPAVPRASYHRLDVSTATVSVSLVAGRILGAWRSWRATVDEDWHYSFAVPL